MAHRTKRTYQPSKRRRARRLGFLARKRKSAGVLARRRQRGRARLTPVQ
ncbi:MAG: 50S ribosomal protein L34 [Candidatus Andersenbacteria bacterium]